jgi:predicted lipoprotein with Yx(FWY)xxD motif
MRRPKIIIAGISLAAVAAIGGVTAASASGPAGQTPPAARSTSPAGPGRAAATVRTASAAVAGKTETILVNAHGLPLYFYRPDLANRSLVTGALAQLWPPLTAAAPTAAGLNGNLTVVSDVHGHQVAFHGHPLYTFASDHPGQVTGQGVQGFFVATPGVPSAGLSRAGSVPPAPSGGGLGY